MSDDAPAVPPLLALVVAVLAISTSAILVRWSDAPNVVKALYRVTFTVVALLPFAAREGATVARFDRRELASPVHVLPRSLREQWDRRDGLVAAASGVALAAHFALWFESLDHTSVAASVTLVQAQPVFVVVGAWLLLGERVSRRGGLGVAVAMIGMVVLSVGAPLVAALGLTTSTPLAAGSSYGNALALLGAVAVAAYYLAGRSLRRRLSVLPYVLLVYTVCAAVLLGVALVRGDALLAYPPHEWALFAAMALGPGVLGHTVVNWALGHVESHVVSVSLLGEPVGSTLLAVLFFSEVPTAWTVVGGVVVLAGIYVTASARTPNEV